MREWRPRSLKQLIMQNKIWGRNLRDVEMFMGIPSSMQRWSAHVILIDFEIYTQLSYIMNRGETPHTYLFADVLYKITGTGEKRFSHCWADSEILLNLTASTNKSTMGEIICFLRRPSSFFGRWLHCCSRDRAGCEQSMKRYCMYVQRRTKKVEGGRKLDLVLALKESELLKLHKKVENVQSKLN